MKQCNLSQSRQQLLKLIKEIQFGRIENLSITAGEPVFNSSIRVIRQVLLGKKLDCREKTINSSLELKAQVIEMFSYFDQLQKGIIPLLKIQDGLPLLLQLEETIH